MNLIQRFQKTPAEYLDYDVDFSMWLPEADVIIEAEATMEEGTATVALVEFDDQIAKVWISGGTATEICKVLVSITTEEGREKQSAFELAIKEF